MVPPLSLQRERGAVRRCRVAVPVVPREPLRQYSGGAARLSRIHRRPTQAGQNQNGARMFYVEVWQRRRIPVRVGRALQSRVRRSCGGCGPSIHNVEGPRTIANGGRAPAVAVTVPRIQREGAKGVTIMSGPQVRLMLMTTSHETLWAFFDRQL